MTKVALALLVLSLASSRARGLASPTSSEYWNQHLLGVPGDALDGDQFSFALAQGDFDGDHLDDLAIGVPSDGSDQSGGVHVFYGTSEGFSIARMQYWSQTSPGWPGESAAFDGFGFSLAAGDFDGDELDDLAIGAPGKDNLAGMGSAGTVFILYGAIDGLDAAGIQVWNELNVPVTLDALDRFGAGLAAGSFNDDEFTDLAIGVPLDTVIGVDDAGAVVVLYGTASGLTQTDSQVWHQDVAGVQGAADQQDRFGYPLATGDFDGDELDDLAIGVPSDTVGAAVSIGSVQILYGSADGITASGNQLWNQDSPGIAGVGETGDYFGGALAIGDFDGSGTDDLAIGATLEDLGAAMDAGALHILHGNATTGLSSAGSQLIGQGSNGTPGATGTAHSFAFSLTTGDFDDNGITDLAAGAPGDRVGAIDQAGSVTLFRASPQGLLTAGSELWSEATPGVPDVPAAGDGFGWALAAGNFRGGGADSLAIGALWESVEGQDAGALIVLHDIFVIFADGFASGDSTQW